MKQFKIILILAGVTLLSGCNRNSLVEVETNLTPVKGVPSITELCLNGVSYYHYFISGKAGMAVNIDRDTLLPKGC